MKSSLGYIFTCVICLAAVAPVYALPQTGYYVEDMTSPEISARIKEGATAVIIPTGGSEQNGRHLVIGKHNKIIYYTSGEIAEQLGNALIAPVIAYVPEGSIEPAQGHMKFSGTISLREEAFKALLEDTAASFKQHGFKLICFIGEHGGSQKVQNDLAKELSEKWKESGVRVINVSDYYDNNNGQDVWVKSLKIGVEDPSAHAGFSDTSELAAVDAGGVRDELRGKYSQADLEKIGAGGDSTLASVEYGKYLLNLKIQAAVRQIKNATAKP